MSSAAEKEVGRLQRKAFRWGLAGLFLLTLALIAGSYAIQQELLSAGMRQVALIVLGALFATVLHEFVLRDYFRHSSGELVQQGGCPEVR